MLITVWLALGGLAAGEIGRAMGRRAGGEPSWAWPVSAAGCIAMILHMLLAMAGRHGWSHDAALQETARQTFEVYGRAWGGGLYVNYAFVALWLTILLCWKLAPPRCERWRGWPLWIARAFVLIVVFNGAVVFASPARRWLGLLLTVVLAGAWALERGARSSPAPGTHFRS